MSEAIDFADFLKVDIRVGRITRTEAYPQAHKPAIRLWIDFGAGIGERKSSAQLTAHYDAETLLGRQVMAYSVEKVFLILDHLADSISALMRGIGGDVGTEARGTERAFL